MEIKNVVPTRDELLAELAAELAEPEIPDNGITIKMLMLKTGKPFNTCRNILNRKVYEGLLKVVVIKTVNYYYPKGG
jgi:hypothetical protein